MAHKHHHRVQVFVDDRWTVVLESYETVRTRWERALKEGELLELHAWDGLLLIRPDALAAVSWPLSPPTSDDEEEVMARELISEVMAELERTLPKLS